MKNVTITMELTEDQASSLALFLKRVTWGTCERLSDGGNDKAQTESMIDAVSVAERSLGEAGFSHR